MNSGIAGDTINGWFGGRTSPKLSDLEKMANALGYTIVAVGPAKKGTPEGAPSAD